MGELTLKLVLRPHQFILWITYSQQKKNRASEPFFLFFFSKKMLISPNDGASEELTIKKRRFFAKMGRAKKQILVGRLVFNTLSSQGT